MNSTWSDPELIMYLNDGIRTFFLDIKDLVEGNFDSDPVLLDIVQGVDTVALPSNCAEVRAVYMVQNTENILLSYNNNLTESYSTQGDGSSSVYYPYYYFRGNSLVLRPAPSFSQTGALLLEYTALPDVLLFGNDPLNAGIGPIYKELVIMHAVYKAKLADDMVNGGNTREAAKEHLSDIYNKFKESSALRSKNPVYIKPFSP